MGGRALRHSLPSLNALRAVEAVSRHGSISGAAREMHVTPGAVSRQVALLEAHFGCSLFVRTQRGLTLSEKGAHYFTKISEAFDLIHTASENLIGHRDRSRLSVRALGSFATDWLLPRLHNFEQLHPNIDVFLRGQFANVDFDTDDADVAIVIDPGHWSSLQSEKLHRPSFLPVMAPELLQSAGPLLAPSELQRFRLLHALNIRIGWADWLKAVDASDVDAAKGHWLESSSQVYQAARHGIGIALGQLLLVGDDLISGRLVAPFDTMISWPDWLSYYLVWPRKRKPKREVTLFRDWLVNEVRTHEKALEAALPNLRVVATPGRQATPAATSPL
jgi:LysR family glycine cleavage system transcriptional activator